eukprot:GFYU01001018.1.p1 GENE.GFYU01001018.1~~GFYU01001018.1.p1  ORF type:complete len:558 (+),score=180.84 GFYU01001018.1:142-1815(+)
MAQQTPVLVMNTNTKRETGRKAQLGNIQAAKAVAEIIRTTLGPKSMLKMLLDPMGGIVMTNDGNAILREIDVSHPAAKSMIELSRTQDEEVGDGTTSVIILAGEMLSAAELYLERNIHPTNIVAGYKRALEDAVKHLESVAFDIDVNDNEKMINIIQSCLGTKFASRWETLMCKLALDAVKTVTIKREGFDKTEIDLKRYAKVEKIPGGELEDSLVINGVMINKDVTHSKMKRKIENPRILLLDCSLEYKKGESQTDVELKDENAWMALLQAEEDYIQRLCEQIIAHKPDLVITEKGVSDLAQHFFVKNGITAIRRLRKTDNNRVARVCGATIVHRPEEIQESDIGTKCGLFEVRKIGDDYFTFLEKCAEPKACTILLRGASKDVLNEIERNLHDAMAVARNVYWDPRLVAGGGSSEMALSSFLNEKSKTVEGVQQRPYQAVAQSLEVIPRTLAQNCGAPTVRVVTELRAKQVADGHFWGIDGNSGKITNMKDLGIWEPLAVKMQTIKTSIEAACMLLRIDEIVSGISSAKNQPSAAAQQAPEDAEGMETFGDARDG